MDVDGVLKYISIMAQERPSKNSSSANKLGLSESHRSHFRSSTQWMIISAEKITISPQSSAEDFCIACGFTSSSQICCIMKASSLGLYTFSTARRSKTTDPIIFLDPTVPQNLYKDRPTHLSDTAVENRPATQ